MLEECVVVVGVYPQVLAMGGIYVDMLSKLNSNSLKELMSTICNTILFLRREETGTGEMAQGIRVLAVLQETWIQFSAPTWWLHHLLLVFVGTIHIPVNILAIKTLVAIKKKIII